jgi:hypothetical protein
MTRMTVKSLLVAAFVCGCLWVTTAPATAQYRPLSSSGQADDRAIGESYHIELAGIVWKPTSDFMFRSDQWGLVGTDIDLDQDLGLSDKTNYEVRLVLRPFKKHKIRVNFVPLKYTGDAVISRELIFNGIKYPVSSQVQTDFKWNTYRFTYEYDVLYKKQGYLGILLETKYADTELTLDSSISSEYVKAQAPLPAIGLVGRVYPVRFVSITGEFLYFKLPDKAVKDTSFHSLDFDVYGTVNIGNNFGIQAGYRSVEMVYADDENSGSIKLKGPYVGGVVRF